VDARVRAGTYPFLKIMGGYCKRKCTAYELPFASKFSSNIVATRSAFSMRMNFQRKRISAINGNPSITSHYLP
ncbi:hypothetical protein ACI3PL_27285, partial [Lacticaseibacillus paracasei]